MIIKAKNFLTRTDLENEVRKMGLTADLKPDCEIQGTRQELARLYLSDRTTFYGIKCIITDIPTEPNEKIEKIQRGEIHKSGLNLNENKNTIK